MKRVLLAGAGTGAHWNTGDAAILAAMVRQLRDVEPHLDIQVASANPEGSLSRYGVKEVRYDKIGDLVTVAESSDLLILGGGGLFFDYWGFPADEVLTPNHAGLAFYTGFATLATLLRKPLMMYAVGVGPLHSAEGKRFTSIAFDQADTITVRDSGSRDLLASLGVIADKITVTADPAFTLPPASPSRIDQIFRDELPSEQPSRPMVGAAIRDWDIGVDPQIWEAELAAGLDSFLDSSGGTIVLIPFHRTVQRLGDEEICRRVRGLMRYAGRVFVLKPEYSPEEHSGIVSRCDAVVAMRLHAVVFARTHGVPVVAISYDPKVENSLSAQLSRFSIRLPELTGERIATLLTEVWTHGEETKRHMTHERETLIASAGQNARAAAALLARGSASSRVLSPETNAFVATVAERQLHRVGELERAMERLRMESQQRQEAIDWLQSEIRLRDAGTTAAPGRDKK